LGILKKSLIGSFKEFDELSSREQP
jgi:hypothetical protein